MEGSRYPRGCKEGEGVQRQVNSTAGKKGAEMSMEPGLNLETSRC